MDDGVDNIYTSSLGRHNWRRVKICVVDKQFVMKPYAHVHGQKRAPGTGLLAGRCMVWVGVGELGSVGGLGGEQRPGQLSLIKWHIRPLMLRIGRRRSG